METILTILALLIWVLVFAAPAVKESDENMLCDTIKIVSDKASNERKTHADAK